MTTKDSPEVLANLWLVEAEQEVGIRVWEMVYDLAVELGADHGSATTNRARGTRWAKKTGKGSGQIVQLASLDVDARGAGTDFLAVNLYRGSDWLAGVGEYGEEVSICCSFSVWVEFLPSLLAIWPDLPFDLVRVESC